RRSSSCTRPPIRRASRTSSNSTKLGNCSSDSGRTRSQSRSDSVMSPIIRRPPWWARPLTCLGFPKSASAAGRRRWNRRPGCPRLPTRRDDGTVPGVGGNSLRKLEFLLGRALADGADTVVPFGGVQTNHGRQTAAACARLGLACELVLTRVVPRDGDAYEL